MTHLNGQRVLIGLSGGINSMALLCHLVEQGIKPKEVHLFYAHFAEHSPDTFQFVADGIRYARQHFDCVKVRITSNSVLRYFESQNMIPHPMYSPCTRVLKIEAISKYAFENELTIDLVGYVRNELKRRSAGQNRDVQTSMFGLNKEYTIGAFDDEWCFEIVQRHIGWYPYIYTILDAKGNRVFKHNNCLPCKNHNIKDIQNVRDYFPEYYSRAMITSMKLKKHWGRNGDDFYKEFGRDLGQDSSCEYCVT